MSFSDIGGMAKTFIESGLFSDIRSVAQAIVKIQAGQELGVAPFAAINGIHIIQGKPVLGAGLIAAKIKGSEKYNYSVVGHTENMCSIDFYCREKKIGNSTFTMEDAKKAGTKNLEKHPKNMLFARAISNGAKWHCPDIFNGAVYTEGEIVDADFILEGQTIQEVRNAIAELDKQKSIEELKKFKISLPQEIQSHPDFMAKGKEVMQKILTDKKQIQ